MSPHTPEAEVSRPSLAHVVAERARRAPDARALTFVMGAGDERHVTNAQLDADARRHAQALEEAGVAEGDLVVIAGEHGYGVVAAFFGAVYRGAVPALFPYFAARAPSWVYEGRVQALIEQTRARAVFTLPALHASLAERLNGVACPVLALPEADESGSPPLPRPASARGGEDIAFVQFSSGTTSLPKGIEISHRAALDNLRALEDGMPLGPGDAVVSWVPLYHDLGLIACLLAPLYAGGRSVLIGPSYWIRRPASLLRAVHAHGGTVSFMPNFAFVHLVRRTRASDLDGLDLSGLHAVMSGGEVTQRATLDAFAEHLAPYGFRREAVAVGYGLAEAVAGVTYTPPGTFPRVERLDRAALAAGRAVPAPEGVEIVSCGRPFSGITVEVVGPDGTPRPERAVGEVVVSGETLFSAYRHRPEHTAERLREGRFWTGDLAYLADGELYFCDRKDDLVIVGGRNVYPDHAEAAVADALGARAKYVAAFGLADDAAGTQRLVVVVEPKGRLKNLERTALLDAARHAVLAAVDVAPADVRVVERGVIVRTTSGKISRAATRQQYLGAGFAPPPAAPAAVPDGATLDAELRDLARVHLGFAPDPAADLYAAGAGSIRIVELMMAAADRYGAEVGDAFLARPTLDRLAAALRAPDDAPTPLPPALEAALRAAPPRVRPPVRVAQARRHLEEGGLDALWTWCGRRRVQESRFRRETALVRRVAALVHPGGAAPVQQSLFTNAARWTEEWGARDTLPYLRRVRVHGAEALSTALGDPSGGLIVTSHSAGHHGLMQVLRDQGAASRVLSVRRVGPLYQQGWTPDQVTAARASLAWPAYEQRVLTEQLAAAMARLRSGGLVTIAGDGPLGESGEEVPFFGRTRWVGHGFAEMAQRSGAAVVATFDVLHPDGTMHVHVVPVERPPVEGRGAWVRAYVAQLERFWQDHLGALRWSQLRRFDRAPASAS